MKYLAKPNSVAQ
jgi:hypothetical protein